MKRKIIVKNNGKYFNFDDYVNDISKKILMDDDLDVKKELDNKGYCVYKNDKKLFDLIFYDSNISRTIRFVNDNFTYEYNVNNKVVDNEYVTQVELFNYSLINNNVIYIFMRYNNFLLISIKDYNGNSISLTIDIDISDEKKILNLISNISIDDDVFYIYEKLSNANIYFTNFEISKNFVDEFGYKINNSFTFINGELISYLNSFEKDNKKNVIRMENNSYSCFIEDCSLDKINLIFNDNCFIDKQLQTIKKLEKKK